jgi:poly(A) polymerase
MVSPIVVARAEHSLSRRDIDPDALKVLYRLHGAGHVAYLVGGSVRDLLLGRRPKDFDIGTDAHPYQVKRLFRNCWIIGRRFRLAHVKFGTKAIEVATFRTQVVPGTEGEPPVAHDAPRDAETAAGGRGDHLIHRDNTFGTPEEDAFRRDFTVNALFYDIGTFAVIDYVGGLQDLQDGVIRCIGDPDVRFREDPVRMLRAVVLQARLGFRLDPPVRDAISRLRGEIARSAPARLMEEVYKILRSGAAASSFRELAGVGLLGELAPRIPTPLPEALVSSLAALDAYRAGFAEAPPTLTNPVLLGTVLAPLGLASRHPRHDADPAAEAAAAASGGLLGMLPVARRDVERLSYALALVRRLEEVDGPPRARATLMRRHAFPDALTWLEIRGEAPRAVTFWRDQLAEAAGSAAGPAAGEEGDEASPGPDGIPGDDAPRRRRRRRRGRRRPA